MKRAAFMRGNFGIMTHWLHTPVGTDPLTGGISELAAEWNARVDAFDVASLASQVNRTGAKWFILTIGQNSGFYCAPNPVYDELVGYPKSKCSRRDLFRDLAIELNKYGIKAIAYLPSGAPEYDLQAVERLEWKDGVMRDEKGEMLRAQFGFRLYDTTHRLENFQRKWEDVITSWAKSWGNLCAGWWVDGMYYIENMYRTEAEPNYTSLARALRSGNPDAALAFNHGIQRMDAPFVLSAEEDYSPGELNSYMFTPFGRKKIPSDMAEGRIGHTQFHLLNYLGTNWGEGNEPRFPDELTVSWTKYILAAGGAVTWDVPTGAAGIIPERIVDTLSKL
ncbi:MAG: hypothetical protein FWE91_06410 [Defluviitaleaceae bacterium]|nr:hypothetical protein [Defluviitaleaceae bacterium]MCL2836318.1 hypothetical protein [Defluviitaleaceae bacterium]